MSVHSIASSSDHPIELPVGLREIKTIDAKIANLTPEISQVFIPKTSTGSELKSLKEYRAIIISFEENLYRTSFKNCFADNLAVV